MDILVYMVNIGYGITIFGGILFVITAFKKNPLWGLGCLLIYPISLIFLILHWKDAKMPFLIQISGIGIIFIAVFLGT